MLKTRIIPVLLLKGNSIVKTVKFKENDENIKKKKEIPDFFSGN